MLPKGLLIIAAMGLVFASPSARADICFQYGTGGGIIVAKGASVPAPNTCIPVALVEDPLRCVIRGAALILENGDGAPSTTLL